MEEIGNFENKYKNNIIDKLSIKYDIAFGQRSVPTLNIHLGGLIRVNKDLFSMEKSENVDLEEEEEEGKPGGQNMIWAIILVHLKAKEPSANILIVQVSHLI